MATEVIGRCTCPVCASDKASLRLSAKQLSYVHCNTCHFQGFARSDHSDGKLRALLLAEPITPEPSSKPAAVIAPAPTPAASKRPGWGFRMADAA